MLATLLPDIKNRQGFFYTLTEVTRRIKSPDGRRALAGNFAEEILASALDVEVLKTDTRCPVCPDGKRGRLYYEFKASGVSKKEVVIYTHRMEKEAKFAQEHPLHYAVLEYDADFTHADNCRKLYDVMVEGATRILVVTVETMHKFIEGQDLTPVQLKPGQEATAGWHKNGYERGYYRVPLSKLRPLCTWREWAMFDVRGRSSLINVWWEARAKRVHRDRGEDHDHGSECGGRPGTPGGDGQGEVPGDVQGARTS
jgi:hypothetical protein